MAIVGLVIPTIFSRPTLLPLAIESILSQRVEVELIVGCPENMIEQVRTVCPPEVKLVAETPGVGLAQKINDLISQLSPECKFVGWLGDDDLLSPGSLQATSQALTANPAAPMAFGGCQYIDPEGNNLFLNRSGEWAVPLLRFGPQLIPQPGSLFNRSAFEEVGGLSPNYTMAFDFDLFLKFSKLGKIVFIPQTLASFRWHPGSLSVSRRWNSVSEASRVRVSHLPTILKPFAWVWEWPVRWATYWAGATVSGRHLATFQA
jgi:GT2 family glycosyltransferase